MPRSARKFAIALLSAGVAVVALAAPAAADDPVTVSVPDAPAVVGASYQPHVDGGQDGTAGTVSISTPDFCTLEADGVTVHFDHAGACTLVGQKGADQSAPVTFTIGKAEQTITFVQPIGGPLKSSETLSATSDSGLSVSFSSLTTATCTVTGNSVTYDHAGLCTIAADQAGDDDHNAAAEVTKSVTADTVTQTITFIQPADGVVQGGDTLVATSDSGLPVSFSSLTAATCSVTGSAVSYLHAGTCTVAADQNGKDANGADTDYKPAAQVARTVTIGKGSQSITLAQPADAPVGTMTTLSATSTSDLPVTTFSSLTAATCTVTGSTVKYDHVGTCIVAADQPETADFTAAPQATSTDITITKADQQAQGNGLEDTEKVGVVHELGATSTGGETVTWSVSPADVCTLSGTATTLTFLHHGVCALTASAPGNDDYNLIPADTAAGSVVVTKGDSLTDVSVRPDSVVATVAPVLPAAPSPDGGTVSFTVDDAPVGQPVPVTNGAATLDYVVPTGAAHTVVATYSGTDDLAASNTLKVRSDPTINVATIKSAVASKGGWYRKPVTVTFTCTKTTGEITSCTKPVTLIASGKQRAVTGTVTAADGGAGSVATTVNIDSVAPTAGIKGPANGAVYVGAAPKAKCTGSDKLSGFASCTLRVAPRANGVFSYAATAVDKAGNTATARGSYRVQNRYIRGTIFDGATNSYLVQAGTKVTLVALAPTRPRYYLPVYSSNTPHVAGHTFYHDGRQANSPRWSLTVTLPKTMRGHTFWNLGIKIGKTMHNVKVRVTG